MRYIKNIILAFGLMLISLIIGIQISQRTIACENEIVNCDYLTSIKITLAEYGDFDKDNYLDDIIIDSILKTKYIEPFIAFLYLSLILPSGYTISFSFETNISPLNSIIKITILTYNTAIEEGWYTAKLTGIFIFDGYLAITSSSYTFDPPTENGPGEPTAELIITSN